MNNDFLNFDLFAVPDPLTAHQQCQGEGKKEVFIAFYGSEKGQLKSFIQKIFQAAKVDLQEDVIYFFSTEKHPFGLIPLCKDKNCTVAIVFGYTPQEVGVQIQLQPYQITPFNDMKVLFIDALETIYEERQAGKKEKSGALWNALKQLFLTA